MSADEDGAGPALHQHPYPETFVIHAGQALFTVGEQTLVGRAGQISVVPAFTAHTVARASHDRYVATNIHANGTCITEWLEFDGKWRGR